MCLSSLLSNQNRLLLLDLTCHIVSGFSENLMCAKEETMKGKCFGGRKVGISYVSVPANECEKSELMFLLLTCVLCSINAVIYLSRKD